MSRTGFKWNVNELLSLQREFELLQWDVDTIAQKHQRTPNAIMRRLDQEGLADYNVLCSTYQPTTSAHETITLEAVEEEPEPEETITLKAVEEEPVCLQDNVSASNNALADLTARVNNLSDIIARMLLQKTYSAPLEEVTL